MFNSDATSVHLSQFGGTQGTFGTNSMVSGNMSEMQREEEEIIPDEAWLSFEANLILQL